jgi:hypothetical protein
LGSDLGPVVSSDVTGACPRHSVPDSANKEATYLKTIVLLGGCVLTVIGSDGNKITVLRFAGKRQTLLI